MSAAGCTFPLGRMRPLLADAVEKGLEVGGEQ
jgi:hypothetical protein